MRTPAPNPDPSAIPPSVVAMPSLPRKLPGDPTISSQVQKILDSLPADGRAAVIDVGVDERGIRVAAAANLGAGWTIMGELDKRFAGEWTGRAQLRWAGR